MSSLPVKIKSLLILPKKSQKLRLNFSRGDQFHMKTRFSLKYFVTDWGKEGGWGHGISRGTKERACKNSRGQLILYMPRMYKKNSCRTSVGPGFWS